MTELRSPLQAHIVQLLVTPGEAVQQGQLLLVLEAMKMEHEICAPSAGTVREMLCAAGDTVQQGEVLLRLDLAQVQLPAVQAQSQANLGSATASHGALHAAPETAGQAASAEIPIVDAQARPDLARVQARHAFTLDASRPEAMAKRHALGLRSARENIADLIDAGSFSEYGALAVAAQSKRRNANDLMRNTPGDGMVCGTASVNGQACVVMAYDATVLAGTQGMRNHQKTDRMLGIALENKLPVILFAEGGGGRPGDVDMPILAGLLCGQCRLAGLLRCHHRHARQQHRHGWPGYGRGRRPRRLRARGYWPKRRTTRQRRH